MRRMSLEWEDKGSVEEQGKILENKRNSETRMKGTGCGQELTGPGKKCFKN